MKIGYALLLGMMIMFIFPRAKQMLKESPKVSGNEWMGVLIPIIAVVLFVMLLIKLV
ncbi:MAG: hypothetical protein OEW89_00295 [Gammaproteobacteria bacterium]|nr:hypothetical protein [Gammaproteobacteria bacterium]MDH5593394.1 hypothetical protein [Gammaproteobacteria bacterium]